jgi:hypothetical protein
VKYRGDRVGAHTVPACRRGDLCTDTAFAHASGEEDRVFFCAWCAAKGFRVFVDAAMADADVVKEAAIGRVFDICQNAIAPSNW